VSLKHNDGVSIYAKGNSLSEGPPEQQCSSLRQPETNDGAHLLWYAVTSGTLYLPSIAAPNSIVAASCKLFHEHDQIIAIWARAQVYPVHGGATGREPRLCVSRDMQKRTLMRKVLLIVWCCMHSLKTSARGAPPVASTNWNTSKSQL
jgi:hypothetical protein